MNQTKLGSLIEALFNTAIGFIVSFIAWPVAAYLFDMEYTRAQHFEVVAFFTVISIARGYVVRRWFNAKLHSTALALAKAASN